MLFLYRVLLRERRTERFGNRWACASFVLRMYLEKERCSGKIAGGSYFENCFAYLFIVAMHVMTVVRDSGSVAPLAARNFSDTSGPDAAAVAAKKSVDRGPSRTPSSLAFCRIETQRRTELFRWCTGNYGKLNLLGCLRTPPNLSRCHFVHT